MISRGKAPAPLGKGGGKGGKKTLPIDEIANRYVVAHWGVKSGEVNLEKLAQSCYPKVEAWTNQSVTDYDEMSDLSAIERFACCFKDEDNIEEILEWWHNRSMGDGSTALVAVDEEEEEEEEGEGDDDSIFDDGSSSALTSSKRSRSSENLDGIDMPPELREFIKRMRNSFSMQLQQVMNSKQEQLKMVGQLMSERVLDRRRIESLENKCNAMRSELNTYATRTNTLDSRLAAADADGEEYCVPGRDDLKPMSNAQIRALARAMQEAFKDISGEERSIMIKLLRFEDLQIEQAEDAPRLSLSEKRSTYKTFARGQLSLNMWKDVAPNLDLAWRLYTYLVYPRGPSYEVVPQKGTHLPSLQYPHSIRLPAPKTPMPFHGDPDGHASPQPVSVMRSMSSLGGSSSAPNLAVWGRNSRTSATPGVSAMAISPTAIGGSPALGASSPSLVQAPVQARYPEAKKPQARKPAKKKKKDESSDEEVEESDSSSLFNSGGEEEAESDEEMDSSTLKAVNAAAAKRGKASSRRDRFRSRQATEQQAADQKAEEDAWAPGGSSFQAAFGGDYALGAANPDERRVATDAIAPARATLPDYSAGV